MKKILLESPAQIKNWTKKGFFVGIATMILVAPDWVLGQASHLLHILYESFSFLLEEILIHGMGFTKHHAQMLVFYVLLLGLAGFGWLIWRRLPVLIEKLKANILLSLFNIRDYALETWLAMTALQKIKLLIINVVGLWLGTSLLLF